MFANDDNEKNIKTYAALLQDIREGNKDERAADKWAEGNRYPSEKDDDYLPPAKNEKDDHKHLANAIVRSSSKWPNPKNLKATLVTPIFKDYKNGKLKIISFFAKKARGQMARYILDNGIETLNELKGFDIDGYGFSAEYTLNENEPVFVR